VGYFKVSCHYVPGSNEKTKEYISEYLVPGPEIEPETFRVLTPGLRYMVDLIWAYEQVNGI
jgi:hypothetical protein